MQRTKSYFRHCLWLTLGLFLLFLTWHLGTLVGKQSTRYTKKSEPEFLKVTYSKTDVNDPIAIGQMKEKNDQEESWEETTNIAHLDKGKELKQKIKKRRKENLYESSLPEALTSNPMRIEALPTSTLSPVPISVQYSWSEVYGETGCSPNPWRPNLVKLFAEWVKIAKKHNIEYILFYGSLLGALRTGDVIPFDSDIDLLMHVKYFPTMKKISAARNFDTGDGKIRLVVQPEFDHNVSSTARKRYTCKGELTPRMIDECSFQEPLGRLVKNNLHIDFYHYYDKGSYIEDPSEEDLKTYDKQDMFPLRPCKFMALDSLCPNKPWKLLKKYFHSNNLESKYKCKNKAWVDKNGRPAF